MQLLLKETVGNLDVKESIDMNKLTYCPRGLIENSFPANLCKLSFVFHAWLARFYLYHSAIFYKPH